MRTHIPSTLLPVSAVCLMVLVVTMLPGAQARAADECAAAPNAAPPAGQHWWYRTDRATKRKCWYLGPQDAAAAPRKADRQERADAPTVLTPEAQPESTQSAPPAPVARSDAGGVQSIAQVQEGVPFLVDWSDLLKEAGIVSSEGSVLKGWADDKAARTVWAMRDQPDQEPVEAQPGKDDARAPQAAAERSDITNSVTKNSTRDLSSRNLAATPAQMPLTFIAALSITGALCLTIFGILRRQRRLNVQPQNIQPDIDGRASSALERAIPAFLQQRDAKAFLSGQGYRQDYSQESVQEYRQDYRQGPGQESDREYDQDYDRAYGGEEELRRILGVPRRRAA